MTIHTHLKKARIDDILIESVHIYRIELHVVFCLYHFLFEKVGHLQISGSVVFLVINNSFLYMAFPILVAFCLTYLPYLIIIQPFLNIPPSFFFFFQPRVGTFVESRGPKIAICDRYNEMLSSSCGFIVFLNDFFYFIVSFLINQLFNNM